MERKWCVNFSNVGHLQTFSTEYIVFEITLNEFLKTPVFIGVTLTFQSLPEWYYFWMLIPSATLSSSLYFKLVTNVLYA